MKAAIRKLQSWQFLDLNDDAWEVMPNSVDIKTEIVSGILFVVTLCVVFFGVVVLGVGMTTLF